MLNYYRCQARTVQERILSNARHTIRYGDRGQARTAIERPFSNARHTIGNLDGGYPPATRERPFSNARHTIRYGDRGQARTSLVFVSCFILEIYTLNGRKVMAYILKKLKKEKFNVFNFCVQNVNT